MRRCGDGARLLRLSWFANVSEPLRRSSLEAEAFFMAPRISPEAFFLDDLMGDLELSYTCEAALGTSYIVCPNAKSSFFCFVILVLVSS